MKKILLLINAIIWCYISAIHAAAPTDLSLYTTNGITKKFTNDDIMDIEMTYLAYEENTCGSPMNCIRIYSPTRQEHILFSPDLYSSSTSAALIPHYTKKDGYIFIDLQAVETGGWHLTLVQENAGNWMYSTYLFPTKETETIISDYFCEGDDYVWAGHFEADGITPRSLSMPGEYRDTLKNQDGYDSICILQLESIPVPYLTIRPDTTIQKGDKVQLWATGADYILWSPATDITLDDQLQHIATPSINTQYTATGYNIHSNGNNLVINGDFESGNVDFETDFTYFTPYKSWGGFGDYTIADNIKGFWNTSSTPSTKAYGGSGNMMILDGMTTPNAIIWRQTVSLTPNTLYAFSAQVMSVHESNLKDQYALLQFAINDEKVGPVFHSPDQLYEWEQYYVLWYNTDATTVTLTIFNQNNSGLGNDFAIDEIRFDELSTLCTSSETVTITIQDTEEVTYDTIAWQPTYSFKGQEFPLSAYESYAKNSVVNLVMEYRDKDQCKKYKHKLTILPTTTIETDTTLCENELPLSWFDQTITKAGTYTHTEKYAGTDIDSVQYMLHLSINPITYSTVYHTICHGETYLWNETTYDTSGTYDHTYTSSVGCDSIVTLQLTVLPETIIANDSATISSNDIPYTWRGDTYSESGTYTITEQFAGTDCDSVIHILNLTVLPTTTIQQDTTLCENELPLSWFDQTITEAGIYTYSSEKYIGTDVDSVLHIINLIVYPSHHTIIEASIYEGYTYEWNGKEYDTAGEYTDTLTNIYGCDSLSTLRLTMKDAQVTIHSIQVVDQCADDAKVEIIFEYTGPVESVHLQFPQDSLDSIPSGLFDITVPMPADGHLIVPYSYIRAGKYDAIVSGYFRDKQMFTEPISLTYLYPSAVLEQRWNDVICVLTAAYNGGYHFTSFQWYQDGQELVGETAYYLSRPLKAGSEYAALLTEANGTQLMTCPLTIEAREEVHVEPTLVERKQPIRCHVPTAGEITLYDLMGNMLLQSSILQGDNTLPAPATAGMYTAKIVLHTGEEKVIKILVQ